MANDAARPYVMFVCGHLPTLNHNGASTYNHAFCRYLDRHWPGSVVVTVRPRLLALAFDPRRLADCPHLEFASLHDRSRLKTRMAAAALGLLRPLARPFQRTALQAAGAWERRRTRKRARRAEARAEAKTVRLTSHEMTAAEVDRLAALVARRGPPVAVLMETIFRNPALAAFPATTRTFLVAHDVFHQRYASLRALSLEVQPVVTADDERRLAGAYDGLIAINSADAASLRELCPGRPVHTLGCPVGVHADAPGKRPRADRIFFIGSSAHPNVDGVCWFIAEVLPALRARRPDVVLDVVGAVCEHVPPAPGVRLLGRVEDAFAVARDCRLAICPLRAGSGLKIKMLDYFSFGLPCVTTAIGAAGLPPAPGAFVIADDAGEFARAVAAWLDDAPGDAARADGARAYATRFSDAGFDQAMDAVFAEHGVAR
jgi:glycosyltransferase involved in cell wall biosynthesis